MEPAGRGKQHCIMAMSRVKIIFTQIRGPFLILAVVLVTIGAAGAANEGAVNRVSAVLLLAGVVLTHISVNLFNELSDFYTGIDHNTVRTPFSGGSGLLQQGITKPAQVRAAAIAALMGAGTIGVYFVIKAGWPVALFMAAGAAAILLYTPVLSHCLLGELAAGLTLGSMVVLGVFYSLTGMITPEILWLSVPPGILTGLLLFLNEFPDAEADKQGGRRHLVIVLGKRGSVYVYGAGLACTYLSIAGAYLFTDAPATVLMALATTPAAVRAVQITARNYGSVSGMIPALGLNVGVVIVTDLLLAVGLAL